MFFLFHNDKRVKYAPYSFIYKYGRGFYCTEHVELAKEWACSTGRDGYANHYQLDMGRCDA